VSTQLDVPIPYQIVALMQEQNRLFAYSLKHLAMEIRATGFRCNCCGACCTRAVSHHIFLLDHDVAEVKKIDPAAYEPAPDPEFCDQNGVLYVSGYSLRMKDDAQGSCWFLENGRCRIYDRRFAICCLYPYMLHREPDDKGKVDWRQISGLDQHGEYDAEIPDEECLTIARETLEYEHAFLTHQIAFLECIHDCFSRHRLRHVQKIYDDRMRQYHKGAPITVMVYSDGQLEKYQLRNGGILR